MRTVLSIMTLVLSAGLLSAAPAPEKKDPTKVDLAKIQGTWEIESEERSGQKAEDNLDVQLTFTNEKYVSKSGDTTVNEGTFKLDATAKVKTIDIKRGDKLALGIYKLDSDTLTICFDESEKTRPIKFESKEGSETELFVLKRVKP